MKDLELRLSVHDLEGSVKNLIDQLSEYPDNAQIVIKEELVYTFGDQPNQYENVIVIRWKE